MTQHKPHIIISVLLGLSLMLSCKSDGGGEGDGATLKSTGGKKAAGKSKDKKDGSTFNWTDGAGTEWRFVNSKMKWSDAEAKCDSFGGKTTKKKFRLPTPGELQDGLKRGLQSSKNTSFGYVYLSHTWTSNSDTAGGAKVAASIDMKNGSLLHTAVEHELSVVCVYIDPAKNRDTWVDEQTGLVWYYVQGDLRSWDDADGSCKAQARVDKLPWRLPEQVEFQRALKDGLQGDKNPSFGKAYIGITWTGESETQYGNEAYAVDLRNGNQYLLGKPQKLATICVRPINY